MFGQNRKIETLERELGNYRLAIARIASHFGVPVLPTTDPDRIATAICDQVDGIGSGTPKATPQPGSEIRPISSAVRKIKLSGAADVCVHQGTEAKMEIFANDVTDLSKILTSVSGDCLTVSNEHMLIINSGRGTTQINLNYGNTRVAGRDYYDGASDYLGRSRGMLKANDSGVDKRSSPMGFRVEVTLPNVSRLSLSGAGNVIYHDIEREELSVDVSGAGTINVAGTVTRLEADVSGAGDIEAYSLRAAHGRLSVSGAGNIKATSEQSVVARVSGVGNIKINGDPPERDADVSGLGKIKFVVGKL